MSERSDHITQRQIRRPGRTRRLVSWIGPSIAVGLVIGAAAGAFAAGTPAPVRDGRTVASVERTTSDLQVLNPRVDAGRTLYVVGSVRADGFRPTGRVELMVDGRRVDSEPLVVSAATLKVRIDPTRRGSHTVAVRYTGGAGAEPSISRSVTVHVR